MKKLLFICLLFLPLVVFAKSYTIEDMTVSFDNKWTVFTRDNIENNKELTAMGLTAEYMDKFFNDHSIYIDAVIYNKDNPTETLENLYGMKPTELKRNLHKYTEKDLKELEEELIKDYKVSDHGIYNTGKYKYVYMIYKDNGLNVIDYYTVINGYGYTIKLEKVGNFTQEELNDLKRQINSISYKLDPAYEKSPYTFDWTSIIIYAAIGAGLGAVASIIKKKKANS